jgi:putative CocE/NonD family hydrolase
MISGYPLQSLRGTQIMGRRWLVRPTPLCLLALLAFISRATAQAQVSPAKYIQENYTKQEQLIPMRDGVRLFTAIYMPKDTSKKYPILMMRTPYSVSPYGADKYREALAPSHDFEREGYIFALQDVRGRFMSEGQFENMRPHIDDKKSKNDIDESSDTYDTIDWLVKNLPNHNGRVGLWGISYPGFYSSAGMIDAHPALKAVSPQAPIADWFFDDFHHHGAFFLPHAFNFFAAFGQPRPQPTTKGHERFKHGTPDGYQFFLDLGPMKNADERYFKGKVAYWNEMMAHPDYDTYWQARNLLPHLQKVAPAVMTVGGWFDAEDLYGACKTYRAIEKQNPGIFNIFVMGPWRHGGWNRTDGERLGNIYFGDKTALFYQKNIELPFFEHFLKDKGENKLPEANVFETGVNRWRTFDHWPPKNVQTKQLYFHANGKLSSEPATSESEEYDEYISDPNKPVPYTEAIDVNMTTEYMTDDQRFASRRPDVLAYQTDVLTEDVTLAGPLLADLRVTTSGTDSDWIVKLIDVFPPDAKNYPSMATGKQLGGYQMMVRSEVIRGRYRESYAHPEPFVANQPAKVNLELQDVLHTFQKGHRIMVQVQSTWFPLVDRNPQKYVPNIYLADAKDFTKAVQRVYRCRKQPSKIEVSVLSSKVER